MTYAVTKGKTDVKLPQCIEIIHLLTIFVFELDVLLLKLRIEKTLMATFLGKQNKMK